MIAPPAHITLAPPAPAWPREAVLIPELAAPPRLNGVTDEAPWAAAAEVELRYPLDADRSIAADTRVRLGRHAATLYLRFIFEGMTTPPAASARAPVAAWQGDGGEIYLAPPHDLDHPRLFAFGLGGARADRAIVYVPGSGDTNTDPTWRCPWSVHAGPAPGAWVVHAAIPLAAALGYRASAGDTLRLDLVRNVAGATQRSLHWAPVRGPLTCDPPDFGFAVLGGSDRGHGRIPAHSERGREGMVFPIGMTTSLVGSPLPLTIEHPLARYLSTDELPQEVRATLLDDRGGALTELTARVPDWPATFLVEPGDEQEATRHFVLNGHDGELLVRVPLRWRRSLVVPATDPAVCRATGPSRVLLHPRNVNRRVLMLREGARLTLQTSAASISVLPAMVFQSPGPSYARFLTAAFRWRIDGGAWRDVSMAAAAPETVLASHLPQGPHTLELEPAAGSPGIEAFRLATEPIGGIVGVVHSDDVGELLTDVRVDVLASDGRLVRTDYTRNAATGRVAVVGLDPAEYRLRITAAGWPTAETASVTITQPGEHADVGLIALGRRGDGERWGSKGPRPGQTVSVESGGTFTIDDRSAGRWLITAELVSEFRTVLLAPVARERVASPVRPLDRVTLRVPPATPLDMYALRVTHSTPTRAWVEESPQAVCVCEALPQRFHLAGVSHMNTWGQQPAEYLARVAATAELAGARTLLVANEVNAAYVAGGLRGVRIPYVVTAGNHTMGRWSWFFADRPHAVDDGPMRIVTFHDDPSSGWGDARALLDTRPEAGVRVLLCYEGYAPIDLIRGGGVSLIFDGHSSMPHPDGAAFPPGVLHLRAEGQESIRWIAMTRGGVDPRQADRDDVPVIVVPREGPSPLRAAFDGPCDGSADRMSVRVVNETRIDFEAARLRLVLRRGDYRVEGARVVQAFDSDDGRRVIDVTFASPAGAVTVVTAELMGG